MGVTLSIYDRLSAGPQRVLRCRFAHLRDSCLVYATTDDPDVVRYMPVRLLTGQFTITEDPEPKGPEPELLFPVTAGEALTAARRPPDWLKQSPIKAAPPPYSWQKYKPPTPGAEGGDDA